MILTVTGGSGSGKSAWAEDCVLRLGPAPRIYLATMRPQGAEAQRRIRRHVELRQNKGFRTLERPLDLAGIASSELEGANVLLEDLMNLTANELFDGAGAEAHGTTDASAHAAVAEKAVLEGVCHLARHAANLVIVTGELGGDGTAYAPQTGTYLALLGRLNRAVCTRSDAAAEVVCGLALALKGDLP